MADANVVDKSISVAIVWLFYCLMYFLSIGKINLKERNIFITLGTLTYPLYLIHNVAGKSLIDKYSHIIPEQIMIILVTIIMILASWVIHLVIEKPLSTLLKNYLLSIFERDKRLTNKSH